MTINGRVPPREVIDRGGAVAQPGLVVTCRLQARLTGSSWEFNLEPKGWIERSFLTGDTARWAWDVGPKIGGSHLLTLNVRPIMQILRTRDYVPGANVAESIAAAKSDVQSYEVRVHVKVPWTERPAEVMSRLAATFKVAQGMVESFTLLLVAVLSLAATLGIKKARKKGKGARPRPTTRPHAAGH